MKRFSKTKAFLVIMLSLGATGHIVGGQTTNTFPSTGNAGIGTASPFLPLHIQGTKSDSLLPLLLLRNSSITAGSAVSLDFTNFSSTQTSGRIGARIQALRISSNARHALVFSTADANWALSEKMRLTDAGDLGIGTSSPLGKLDVSAQFYTSTGNSIVLRAQDGTSEGGQLRFDGAGTNRYFYLDNFVGNLRFFSQDSSGESEKFRILNNGSVGIGTTTPGTYKLNVNGTMYVSNAITAPNIATHLGNTDQSGGILLDHSGYGFVSSSNWKYGVLLDPDNGQQSGEYFAVYDNLSKSQITDANAFVKFDPAGNSWINTGNVGIGTSTPDANYKLSVNGKIRTKEVVVEANWSDFVFADNYRLTPLSALEQSIKQNRRLPGIPSEKEVAENGVSVGEMQSKLLQKIEELTLYVIELKKENDRLHERVDMLEKQQQ